MARPMGINSTPKLEKFSGLKAVANLANGGIGVSYSNVVLGGGINPSETAPMPLSLYRSSFDPTQSILQRKNGGSSPVMTNNYSHKNRFINRSLDG
jgi:hypothetical protein